MTIFSQQTQIMVGEKGADLIKSFWLEYAARQK